MKQLHTRHSTRLVAKDENAFGQMGDKNIRGTRPFEGMVPGAPWTAQFMTLDKKEALISRCGASSQRHKDGTLRENRPLPSGYTPRVADMPMKLSPRWERLGGVYEWGAGGEVSYKTTSAAHFGSLDTVPGPAPTRLGRSPRHRGGEVYELMFGAPSEIQLLEDRASLGRKPQVVQPPAPSSPRAEQTPRALSTDLPVSGRRHASRRLAELERALHEERRTTARTRAVLESELRWIPFDPRSYHNPDGQPFRKA